MRIFSAISFVFLGSSIAFAQDFILPPELAQRAAGDPSRFREQMIQQLFSVSPDGRLTDEQAQIHGERTLARNRANARQQWYMHDLDGDGAISVEEARRLRLVMPTRERSRFEGQFLSADANGDGSISHDEIVAIADANLRGLKGRQDHTVETLRSLDADRDGVVTVDDIVAALATLPDTQIAKQQKFENAGCNVPAPTDKAEVIAIGAYQGQAVSTVAVAGRDKETSLAVIEIEPGETPIYIVAAVFEAMILKVTGATERVERIVGASAHGLGVVGLPKDKVTFAPAKACGFNYFRRADEQKAIRTKASIAAELGRAPNQMFGTGSIAEIALPSGKGLDRKARQSGLTIIQGNRRLQVTEDGIIDLGKRDTRRGNAAERDLLRHYPAGIATVMPEDVVTMTGSAQAYDVLPQQAGLVQLLDSGALKLLSDGSFAIEKPIPRFPAGLNGGHSVQFVLRKGVPMPKGSPGHSSVLSEETGECIGARCR